jgi:hypothetical protein
VLSLDKKKNKGKEFGDTELLNKVIIGRFMEIRS